MICPVCHVDAEPAAVVGAVVICATCGATNAIEADGTTRRARYDDIAKLTDEQTQTLKVARRGKVRRK